MASREFKPLDAMSDPAMAPFLAHSVGQRMFEASVVDGTLARVVGEPVQFPNSSEGDVAWQAATRQIRDKQAAAKASAEAEQFDSERSLRWVEVHGDAAGMLPVLTDTERLKAVTLKAAEDAARLTPNVLRELLSERRSAPSAPQLVFAAHEPGGSAAPSHPVLTPRVPRDDARPTGSLPPEGSRRSHELGLRVRRLALALGQTAVVRGMRRRVYDFMEWGDRPPTLHEIGERFEGSVYDLGVFAVQAYQGLGGLARSVYQDLRGAARDAHRSVDNAANNGSKSAAQALRVGRFTVRLARSLGQGVRDQRQGVAKRESPSDESSTPQG